MITINDKRYDFKFTIKRIELIESVINKPLMGTLINNRGLIGLQDLHTLFAYGLKAEDGPYLNVMNAKKVDAAYEQVLDELGYPALAGMALQALERDCPFLFRDTSQSLNTLEEEENPTD